MNEITFDSTEKSFSEISKLTDKKFDFAKGEKITSTWHGDLHDGVNLGSDYYCFWSEGHYFREYLKSQQGSSLNAGYSFYSESYSNVDDLGCSGKIITLGRYFSSKYQQKWGSIPRGQLAANIYDCKEVAKIEQFDDWNSELVEAMKNFIIYYLEKTLKEISEGNDFDEGSFLQKLYKPNIIVTSIPNSNGKNRFSSFLEQLKSLDIFKNSSNIIFLDNLFIQKREPESERSSSYSKKKELLSGLYKLNTPTPLINSNTRIIIIDDVLTSGAHFEECLQTLKKVYRDEKYEVDGVFLSATQSSGIKYNGQLNYRKQSYQVNNI